MSVMLRTTNPQAADEIDPSRDRRVPYIGQTLLFHARSGEGRAGRHIGVAICINIRDDDMIDLIVTWDADDRINHNNVPRKTEQNPVHAWGFTEYDDEHYQRLSGAEASVEMLTKANDSLTRELDALTITVEGHSREIESLKTPRHPSGALKQK